MIPLPIDPGLLREHAFADIGNLQIVLHPDTYTDIGGHKSTLQYGLGYFNYILQLDQQVSQKEWIIIFRGHIYQYFNIYIIIFIIISGIWITSILDVKPESTASLLHLPRWNKNLDKEDTVDYHHIKI